MRGSAAFIYVAMILAMAVVFTDASHFRGGTITFSRPTGTSLEVEFEVVTHWYTGGINPRPQDLRINFGDEVVYSPSAENFLSDGIVGTIRTIIYNATHTYPSLGLFIARVGSCCRQNAVINGNGNDFLQAGVNLGNAMGIGNPKATIEGRTDIVIGHDATFGISPTTPANNALVYSYFGSSGLDLNPPQSPTAQAAYLVPRVPASQGVVTHWNTSSGSVGAIYAISIRADYLNIPDCFAVWDIALVLSDNNPPTCGAGSGAITSSTDGGVSISYQGIDLEGEQLSVTVIGLAPSGSTFAPSMPAEAIASGSLIEFNWPPPLAAGSYSWSVQFCDLQGLCGSCSSSVTVNDELPQLNVRVAFFPSDGSQVGTLGDEYTFNITVVNDSPQSDDPIVLESLTSSMHGSLDGQGSCSTNNVTILFGESYNCSYTAIVNQEGSNVISVQGQDDETSIASASDAPVIFAPLIPSDCQLPGPPCTASSQCGVGTSNPGICSSTGACQCGVGYMGNASIILDPVACIPAIGCVVPPLDNTVDFLNEPSTLIKASAGQFIFEVEFVPYLKQTPAIISFVNPVTNYTCNIMPLYLGTCSITQEISPDSGLCRHKYTYTEAFSKVVFQGACWVELPPSQENGSNYKIFYRSFKSLVEVLQGGYGAFGQVIGGSSSSSFGSNEASLDRKTRRFYVIKIATQFRPQSNPFLVLDGGIVRYRLVKADYALIRGVMSVVVETQVAAGGRIYNSSYAPALSQGLAPLTLDAETGGCEASSSPGFCNQFHHLEFNIDPCNIAGKLALMVTLSCDDETVNATTCGFTNVNLNSVYALTDMDLIYNACPEQKVYGVNVTESKIRLYTDSLRTQDLTTSTLIGETYFGRTQIFPSVGALFESVTLTALNMIRVASPANIQMGDQIPTNAIVLLSPSVNTSPISPFWDFELFIDANIFNVLDRYYLEAVLEVVFANTGVVSRRKVRFAIDRKTDPDADVVDGVFSQTFPVVGKADQTDGGIQGPAIPGVPGAPIVPGEPPSSDPFFWIILSVSLSAVFILVLLLVCCCCGCCGLGAWRRREKRKCSECEERKKKEHFEKEEWRKTKGKRMCKDCENSEEVTTEEEKDYVSIIIEPNEEKNNSPRRMNDSEASAFMMN